MTKAFSLQPKHLLAHPWHTGPHIITGAASSLRGLVRIAACRRRRPGRKRAARCRSLPLYAFRFRDPSLIRARRFFHERKQDECYCLCVLHTVEAWPCTWFFSGSQGRSSGFSRVPPAHGPRHAQGVADGGLLKRKWSLIIGVIVLARARARHG